MNRMSAIIIAVMVLGQHPEASAAFSDYQRHPGSAYLSLAEVNPNYRDKLEQTLRFVVPSLSSKSYLGDQLPERVPGTQLLRLNLDGLGWQKVWPHVIAARYVPAYRPDLLKTKYVPLVVSGLWFAAAVTDSNVTGDMQYQLLYGAKPPKTEKEFKAFWQVNGKGDLSFGRIEGKSGVAVEKTRLIENNPTANRAYFWATLDSRVAAGGNDPLENLTARPLKHDASELIAGIPKHYGSQGGTLQAYFLADAKGNRQEKAPADIVTDDTGTRGVEIRNTLSCIACHTDGIRHPTLDQYRAYILSGARIYAYEKDVQREVDRYLDSPIAKEIARNNEDYAAGVALCNGLTPAQNAALFRITVQYYDQPVSLAQAAREIYAKDENEWRLALGNYSRTYQLNARLSEMASGNSVTRNQWLASYPLAQKVLYAWRATTK